MKTIYRLEVLEVLEQVNDGFIAEVRLLDHGLPFATARIRFYELVTSLQEPPAVHYRLVVLKSNELTVSSVWYAVLIPAALDFGAVCDYHRQLQHMEDGLRERHLLFVATDAA